MKVLKVIGIVILVVVALVVVLGLVAPKAYNVERSVQINAPKELVFNHTKYWKNWAGWSPWAEMDPTMTTSIVGTDGQVGSAYKWTGKEVGEGEMTATAVKANAEIAYHLHFIQPFDSHSDGYLRVAEAEGGTEASWAMFGESPFPWNIMSLFMSMDKMVGKDFDRGLALLKEVSEKDYSKVLEYNVEKVKWSAKTYVAIQKEIPMAQLSDFYMQNFPTLWSTVTQKGAKPLGAPSGIYYKWDEENMRTDVAAALPVNRPVGDFKVIKLPSGTAYAVDYFGPYEQMLYPHMAFDKFFKEKGLKMGFPVVEEYLTDPSKESDSSKWHTKIYYFAL